MKKIAVFISGTGTNMQSIVKACEDRIIDGAEVSLVLASKPSAKGLSYAKDKGIATEVYLYGDKDNGQISKELIEIMESHSIDLIALAGYVKVLPEEFTKRFDGRIVNIHPSLIPLFCGKGYYGVRVHEEVLASGMKVSGATVHYVDSGVDTGRIIAQDSCPILEGDTPETLQKRVLKIEHRIFPEAISRLVKTI